ncbi:hypothetical protein FF36_05485 [Frankia torreyi]|uniref:Uncharacterized protein n=1 Tax=Frankia torreyi TaxID=1856 RepID=A0A0D8B7H1_9ACTN|nr:hypothetical protein FF36_05485 [Frankia torreyi]
MCRHRPALSGDAPALSPFRDETVIATPLAHTLGFRPPPGAFFTAAEWADQRPTHR